MLNYITKSLRKLFSSSDEEGWDRAEKLGVAKDLNQSGDNTYKAFMDGAYKAQWQTKAKGVENKVDLNAVTGAAAKQFLATSMKDQKLRDEADEEYHAAMSGQKTKNYVPLSVYLKKHDQYDHDRGTYSTTEMLANTKPSKTVKEIQEIFNRYKITDKFGDALKVDGIWGPKTESASRSRGLIASADPSSSAIGEALSKGIDLSAWGFDKYDSPAEKSRIPKLVQDKTTPTQSTPTMPKSNLPDWGFAKDASEEKVKKAQTAVEKILQEQKDTKPDALDFTLKPDQQEKLSRYNQEAHRFFTPEQIKRIQDGEVFSRVASELSPAQQARIKAMGSEVLDSLSPKQRGELMFLGSTALSGIDMSKRKAILNHLEKSNGKITFDDLVKIGVYTEDDRAQNSWERFLQKIDYGGGPANFPSILEGEYQLNQYGLSFNQLEKEYQAQKSAQLSVLLATQLLPITNYLTYGPSGITYGNNVYDNLERQGTVGNYQGSKEPWVAKGIELNRKAIEWNSWRNYEKVFQNGQLYAKVGNRLYSKHAVDRMQPSGKRFTVGDEIKQAASVEGRSIAPQFVEDVIESVRPAYQPLTGNYEYISGTVTVIFNPFGAVVTIITK